MEKIDIFPNHLWYFDIPVFSDLKQNFVQEIYGLKSKYKSVALTNRGGWQSQSIFFIPNYRSNNLKILMHKILNKIETSIMDPKFKIQIDSLWYNVNCPGSYNDVHDHPGAHLTGVFYVQVPEQIQKCGLLQLENPHFFDEYMYMAGTENGTSTRRTHQRFSSGFYNSTFMVEPIEGRFYMFPSHIRHRVLTNNTEEDRISFSCNLSISPKL